MAGKTGTAVFAAACGIVILFIGRYPMAAKAKPEKRTISLYSVDKKAVVEAERVHKSDGEWKKLLTPEQFRIARKKGTERAFTGEYHDSKGTGTYRCVCCGTDLFSSEAKYDSGTGWPSFREPVSELNVRYESDRSLFTERTEVLCARCDAHLGHVFDDGPPPAGKRFCMNSASFVFAPR